VYYKSVVLANFAADDRSKYPTNIEADSHANGPPISRSRGHLSQWWAAILGGWVTALADHWLRSDGEQLNGSKD